MKGIELAILDDGRLQIRCLEHNRTHTGTVKFCCYDLMIRAIAMCIQSTPDGYHARMLGRLRRENEGTDLPGMLFDIATTPLRLFPDKEGQPIAPKT
jgi:hypothetical protein